MLEICIFNGNHVSCVLYTAYLSLLSSYLCINYNIPYTIYHIFFPLKA